MESGWTLGIKAVLVFICKLSTLSDATTSPPPPSTTSPPVFVLPDRTNPASPLGQLAAPCPLHLTFLQMTFFNLYNPGKADCAQVPSAVTSKRHFPPPHRWSGISGAFQQGFCQGRPTCSTLFVCLFVLAFEEVAPRTKQITCVCLSHAVFLTIIFFLLLPPFFFIYGAPANRRCCSAFKRAAGDSWCKQAALAHCLCFHSVSFQFLFLFFILWVYASAPQESSCGITQ